MKVSCNDLCFAIFLDIVTHNRPSTQKLHFESTVFCDNVHAQPHAKAFAPEEHAHFFFERTRNYEWIFSRNDFLFFRVHRREDDGIIIIVKGEIDEETIDDAMRGGQTGNDQSPTY